MYSLISRSDYGIADYVWYGFDSVQVYGCSFFILDREDSLDWDLMFEEAEILGRLNDIYYTLYYTEELYPGTVCKKIWKNSNQNQRIFSMNTKEEIIQKKFINGI